MWGQPQVTSSRLTGPLGSWAGRRADPAVSWTMAYDGPGPPPPRPEGAGYRAGGCDWFGVLIDL